MEVTLYTEFSKRKNSTKNPTSPGAISVSVTKNVTLRDKCNMLRPSFFLADTNGYVYLKCRGWYYFIKSESYDINGAHYIDCEIDVLGTWRDIIFATSAFVKYSTSKFNEFIRDDRIATTAKMISQSYRLSLDEYISDRETFMYQLITYSGDPDDNTKCGIMIYLLTNAEMQYLLQQLFQSGDSFFGNIEQTFEDLKSAIIDLSCVPFANNQMGAQTEIIIGKYKTGCTGHYASEEAIIINDALPLSGLNKDDFRILEPYTYAKLFLPFIGLVDISCEELQNAGNLLFTIIANRITRKITYIVYIGAGNVTDNNAKILGIYHGTYGIQIPLAYLHNENVGQFITETTKAMTGAVAMIGGAATGNAVMAVAGAATFISSEVSAYMKANTKTTTMLGGMSGNYGWSNCPYIKLEIFTPEVSAEPDTLATLYGRPLLQVEQIGNLSGYCETRGFSIDISAPDTVKEMINTAMDNGVYLE